MQATKGFDAVPYDVYADGEVENHSLAGEVNESVVVSGL